MKSNKKKKGCGCGCFGIIAIFLLLVVFAMSGSDSEPNETTEVTTVETTTEVIPEATTEEVPEVTTEATTQATTQSTTEKVAVTTEEVSEKDLLLKSVQGTINERIDNHYDDHCDVTRIEVNSNLGTDESDDYIVLVHITWDQMNTAETSKKMLEMFSSDLAATICNEYPEVNEMAIFWDIPYHNTSAKWSYERNGSNFYQSDVSCPF